MRQSFFRDSGLTPPEQDVLAALVAAVSRFAGLPRQHPNETDEFVDAIHRCQGLLALRIARREYPVEWPTYSEETT